MKLVEAAVHRGPLTLLISLLLGVLGLNAFLSTPRSVDPHFPIPIVLVVVSIPNADAEDIEETVVRPIEQILQGLDDIDEINSSSTDSFATIRVEFDWSSNADDNYDEVVREVSAIRGNLPDGIAKLEFRKIRTTESKLLQFALVSETASFRRLEKIAEDLRDLLNGDSEVRQTEIYGAERAIVQVGFDSSRLMELDLTPQAIVDAISAAGLDLPAGDVTSGARSLSVEAGGAFRDLDSIREVALRSAGADVLRVRDIARVEWAELPRSYIVRANGKPALFVTVEQKDGANAVVLKDRLIERASAFAETLPPDVALVTAFNQANDIEQTIAYLARDFAIALTLVILTLLPLGLRAALVVMISIPLSLGVGLLVLGNMGFTLNQLAVSGFIVALGLVVDDSIVVVENIARRMRTGMQGAQAAIIGTQQILVPVLGTTAVLIFAFLPLVFLPEGAGRFTRSLPLAVIASVSGSLLVALTIIPFLASRILKGDENPEGNRVLRFVDRGIRRFYQPLLHRALNAPRRALALSMALCIAALALIPSMGFSLFPDADRPYFLVDIAATEGSSVEETDRIVARAAAIIAQEEDVTGVYENVGAGNPQIFYNVLRQEAQPNFGQILVTLREWDTKDGPALVEHLNETLASFSDAQINISPFTNGPPIAAPIAIRANGPDLAVLKDISIQIEDALRATPGTRDVNNPLSVDRTNLDIGIDPARAAILDIAPGSPRRAIRLALEGVVAAEFRDEQGDAYDVVVSLPGEKRRSVADLDLIHVATRSGALVPLTQIANPRLVSRPARIDRRKLQRSVTVIADTQFGVLAERVNRAALKRVAAITLPTGYALSVGGEAEARADSFAGLGSIALAAVFAVLIILLLEFGRFRLVAITLGVIPLGMFGGLIALFLTGYSLSYIALIGFIALIGIEIKNSVLLVDFTRQLQEEGVALRPAIERAGEIRFLPVLLTAFTAIGGLLPLAIGGAALYAPLAWVLIGGLVSSTLLSRIVTPVLYLLLEHDTASQPTP